MITPGRTIREHGSKWVFKAFVAAAGVVAAIAATIVPAQADDQGTNLCGQPGVRCFYDADGNSPSNAADNAKALCPVMSPDGGKLDSVTNHVDDNGATVYHAVWRC
jgi:hypothetical protein